MFSYVKLQWSDLSNLAYNDIEEPCNCSNDNFTETKISCAQWVGMVKGWVARSQTDYMYSDLYVIIMF
jgi:hypothetical protein